MLCLFPRGARRQWVGLNQQSFRTDGYPEIVANSH